MGTEARRPGLDPREVPILPTFTPDIAAALPGPSWLTRRRAAAAEAFADSPLPTEKDEVWRYSRIDELDPGSSPSPRTERLYRELAHGGLAGGTSTTGEE